MRPGPPIAGFEALFVAAAVLYALYLVAEFVLPVTRRALLGAGVLTNLAGLVVRGVAIRYFPLTNKFESFYAFAFAVFATLFLVAKTPSRVHRLFLFTVGAAFYAAAWRFPRGLSFPPPLMFTPCYPLHVPASFFSYALWCSSAGAALATVTDFGDSRTLRAMDQHAFWGWSVFSLSMIFGGAWGYVAWGAYFLWDPKVVWSVVLWLFYSGFVHLRHWPVGNKPGFKATLSLVGFALLLIAYVGTSFFFSHGSHAFG